MLSGAPAYAHPASGSFGFFWGVEGMVGVVLCVCILAYLLLKVLQFCKAGFLLRIWNRPSCQQERFNFEAKEFCEGWNSRDASCIFWTAGPPRWNAVGQPKCVKTLRCVLVSNHVWYLYIEAGWIGRWLVECTSKLAETQLAHWLRYSSPSGGAAAGVALSLLVARGSIFGRNCLDLRVPKSLFRYQFSHVFTILVVERFGFSCMYKTEASGPVVSSGLAHWKPVSLWVM